MQEKQRWTTACDTQAEWFTVIGNKAFHGMLAIAKLQQMPG